MRDHWDLIDADLHEIYGIDSAEPGLFDTRPWQWFRRRVLGLLVCECRIQRKLAPPEQQPQLPKPPPIPHVPHR